MYIYLQSRFYRGKSFFKSITDKFSAMYAIVDIAGQQFKVQKDLKIFVHSMDVEEGKNVEFEKVLLVDDGSTVKVGAPTVSGAKITAKVLGHVRGEKIQIFKKKRRKGYQKRTGHRQDFTQILIEEIAH